jgi:uncharacterized protein (DUF2141 family)
MSIVSVIYLAAWLGTAGHATPLIVDVQGDFKSNSNIRVAAYASAEQWLNKASAASELSVAGATDATQSVTLAGLVPGRYAIAVYVDENGNGRLDRGMFGIPSEPYGFSNGGGQFGPPPFDKASIDVPPSGGRIVVELE